MEISIMCVEQSRRGRDTEIGKEGRIADAKERDREKDRRCGNRGR